MDQRWWRPHTSIRSAKQVTTIRAMVWRIPDHRVLTEIEGKLLFLPKEARSYPKREAIIWRLSKLG